MGTLFSAFSIAQSGLQTAQIQLNTAAHNIANVEKPGYSRQRAELVAKFPIDIQVGFIGTGVEVAGINRLRDVFLDGVFQRQVSGLGYSENRTEILSQLEAIFLEPTDQGLGSRINVFFDALQEFSTNVEDLAVRQSVATEAQTLAFTLNDTAQRINALRTQANEEIIGFVPEINSIAERIAFINQQIRRLETSGNQANDLRDERGVLLDELAKIVGIQVSERDDGQVDVSINGEVLIDADRVNRLETVRNASLDPERNDLVEVRFVESGRLLNPNNGELFSAFQARDVDLVDADAQIDAIAATIIEQINLIQSQAAGLEGFSGTVTGSNAVTDPAIPLNTAGLPFTVSPGSFDIHVFDSGGAPVGGTPVTINIAAGTTLNDLAAQINAVPNLTATVNADNELEITTAAGSTFSVFNDDTGALTGLGVNGVFTGFDARTIGVNQDIIDNPALLASRFSTDPLDTGDNSAALALAAVRDGQFLPQGTINDAYEAFVVELGVDVNSSTDLLAIEQAFIDDIEARRQAVSGVSLDEEATNLILFQRAFEASARVVTVTDRMLDALLTMAL